MAEFKCISCGAVKESDSICSCPECGYRMFEVPYNRKEKLISEIEGFISHLEVSSVIRENLVFEGKEKDDKRFPDYDKILKYVSGKDRTEDFFRNLLETTEQLKLHFTSEFSKTYPVSFEKLDGIIEQYDEVLCAAAQKLVPEHSPELKPVQWGEVSLLYTEKQNKYLWFSAEELLNLIKALAEKIVKFIKINNLYGNSHKYHPKKQDDKFTEKTDYKDELENAIVKAKKILAKKYVIDLTEDGTKELKEMLTCLWQGIEIIMHATLFTKDYTYLTNEGAKNEDELLADIKKTLCQRYEGLNNSLNLPSLLNSKTEDELFELYKDMIGIDTFGFLVPVGTELIDIGESEKMLDELIGLKSVKESIKKIKAYTMANKDSKDLNIHMCFLGNPGSGKTQVARYIAGILYENKILPTNKVIEVDRSGLVSQYFGATAEKTSSVIEEAMGGVLFIDEAYALGNSSDGNITDYGKEAIDTLVKAMEDYRGKFCVILAGYKNETLNMLSSNPGFKSRIQFILDFPNYSRDELKDITELMLSNRKYTINDSAMRRILDITDIKRKEPNFANAREIRNILDQVIMCQNMRCAGTNDTEIGTVDVNKYIQDAKIYLPTGSDSTEKKLMTGEDELDALIGLASVKRMVKKIKAYAKRNKDEAGFNLHMCFYGNPGTGKTEVARIISRILYDAGVLEEAKLVETDSHGLIGRYMGETAPKTEAKINEAMNGVLFIDEAYGLVNSGTTSYGEEAIAVLLKAMEDKRGRFCVILAGYKNEMKNMLSANPGFESRIQFTLDFPDYSKEELGEIAKTFLKKKKYEIEEPALERLLDITEYYRNRPNFANARTVRNILDQVIMNQNLRTEDSQGDNAITIDDVEDYLTDEGIDITNPSKGMQSIGFV
jgi:SpoVK/Ycf46/Vps4 family AAA+-type ATPase/DNA-directed RNA polymerase subunit RPC12/RpoP